MPVAIARTANPAGASASSNIATYSNISIGVADANRVVALVVTSELASASPSSATIDYGGGAVGMSATTPVGNFGAVYARVFYAYAPTGTTATFAVTFGANASSTQNHVSVYRIVGGVFSSGGGDGSTDMDTTDPLTTGSVTIASNGGFLGVAAGATDTVAKTWANATEDLDVDAGAFRHTTATSTTSGTVTITCTGGTNAEDGALAWALFVEGTNFIATGLAAGPPTVGTPTITQIAALTATAVAAGAPSLESPTIAQVHAFVAAALSLPSPSTGQPELSESATQNDLDAVTVATGAPVIGAPSLTQVHVLSGTGVASSAPVMSVPDLGQIHPLEAAGLTASQPMVDEPLLVQAHVLEPVALVLAAPVVGAPAVDGLTDDLTADAIGTDAPTAGVPELVSVAPRKVAQGTGGAMSSRRNASSGLWVRIDRDEAPKIVHRLTARGIEASVFKIGTPRLSQTCNIMSPPVLTFTVTTGKPRAVLIDDNDVMRLFDLMEVA